MKKIIIIFFTILSISVSAQDSHMAIGMGLAMPLGDFAASEDFSTNGYTEAGFNLNIDFNYVPTWYFGIGANISFSTYGLNESKAQADLIDLVKDAPEIPGLDTVTNFDVGAWSYANFLVGPVLAIPAGNLQFNVKALFGLSVLMPAGNTLEFTYNDEKYTTYNEPQDAQFGMLLGADIIYKLSETYSLKLGGEYFRSKTNYETHFDYVEEEIFVRESNISIQAMHITLGIAYLF